MDIDRGELEVVVELIEEDGPLESLSDLYDAINDAMGTEITADDLEGHIAVWGVSVKTTQAADPKPVSNYSSVRNRLIFTPSGNCPHKLKGTDPASVEEWIGKVREFGLGIGIQYLAPAYIYFVREFYEIFSEEHVTVKNHINALLKC